MRRLCAQKNGQKSCSCVLKRKDDASQRCSPVNGFRVVRHTITDCSEILDVYLSQLQIEKSVSRFSSLLKNSYPLGAKGICRVVSQGTKHCLVTEAIDLSVSDVLQPVTSTLALFWSKDAARVRPPRLNLGSDWAVGSTGSAVAWLLESQTFFLGGNRLVECS